MQAWDHYSAYGRIPTYTPERLGLSLSSAPATEPVTLAEAKTHCRVDATVTADDTLITSLIQAARETCEKRMGQAFVTQTWKMSLDRFASWGIVLPLPPVQSIASITYTDLNGATQTLSPTLYLLDAESRPARLTPSYLGYWPATRYLVNAVQISFVAGYGAASAVPESIKTAIKLLTTHWYENREAVVIGAPAMQLPAAVDALLYSQWHGTY